MLASPDRDSRSATHCGRRAPKHYRCQNSGANSVTRSASKDDALVFTYDNGEKALSAAKKAIKGHPDYRFHRSRLSDGTDCFEVVSGKKVP